MMAAQKPKVGPRPGRRSDPVPTRRAFRSAEWSVIERCRTPRQVEDYLRALPYNHEERGETLRTFRGVIKAGKAHCLEAALAAAAILEQHGYPPLLLDFESKDSLDHVLFLYRRRGRWGTVARSRDAGLHGRKAVFRTLRDLVMSYVDPYVDGSGRIQAYGLFDLRTLRGCNWRLSPRNAWAVERALIGLSHRRIRTSERRYREALARYIAFRKQHPNEPATYFRDRTWL